MIRRLATSARALRSETRGAAVLEFALAAPVLLVGILGLFDLGHNMYTASVLHGSIQKAARDSTIEGAEANISTLDGRVTRIVRMIAPGADTSFNRTSYSAFTDVRTPEDFTDIDGDGLCNNGEPFEDANGNGTWDADRGQSGQGGARDAVMYEVTVTYDRVFPFWSLVGQSDTFTTKVRTVLRNQPYNLQATRKAAGTCA